MTTLFAGGGLVNVPDAWSIWSHSWCQYTVGPTADQTGRFDALLRSRFDIETMNWRNFAVNGARAILEGGTTSGANGSNGGSWVRMFRHHKPTRSAGPYVADAGAHLICFGINDLGQNNGSLAVTKAAIVDSLRSMISRARSSKVWLNNGGAPLAYGAGWGNLATTGENGSTTALRWCTTTTNATITFTLPSDFNGETVAFAFLGCAANAGVVLTWSGTALSGHPLSGTTTDLSGRVDSGWVTHNAVTVRIKGLTSANAGQTIIATTTALGASSPNGFHDSVWLESRTPPPVLVVNVARVPSAQLTTLVGSVYTSWAGANNAARDADVTTLNGQIATMVAEFDGMVQVVDADRVIGQDATRTSDGIHPNEHGGGELVDECVLALSRMTPPATMDSTALSFHPPAIRTGTQRRPRPAGYPYTADYATPQSSAVALPAAGTAFWLPFQVTEPRDSYSQFQVELVAWTSNATIRCGIYDDVDFSGYPQTLPNLYDFGLMTLTTGAGVKSITPTFAWRPDPGLYWLSFVVVTQGTGVTLRYLQSTSPSPLMPNRPTTGTTANAAYVAWTATGVSTTALPQRAPTNATLATAAPLIQMQKTA